MENVRQHRSELDNIRAAIDWPFSPEGDATIGVALVAACAPVWIHLSLLGECRRRAEQALGMLGLNLRLTPGLECGLLMALGLALTLTHCPTEQTRNVIASARRLAVEIGNIDSQLRMLFAQWSMELIMGENGAALATARQFMELARDQNDAALALAGDRFVGIALLRVGELAGARDCLERMVDHYVAPPSGHHTALFYFGQRIQARANLAVVLGLQGFLEQARRQAVLCVDEARESDKVASWYCSTEPLLSIG